MYNYHTGLNSITTESTEELSLTDSDLVDEEFSPYWNKSPYKDNDDGEGIKELEPTAESSPTSPVISRHEKSVSAYVSAQTRTSFYPEVGTDVIDQQWLHGLESLSRHLSYRELTGRHIPNLPPLFLRIVEKLDSQLPTLRRICNGLSDKLLDETNCLLTLLLKATAGQNQDTTGSCRIREKDSLTVYLLNQCTRPSQLAHMLQAFFGRLEAAPFVASASLCDDLRESSLFLSASNRRQQGNQLQLSKGLSKALRDSWALQSIEQQAMHGYFIQRCQRWCQAEVGWQLSMDYSTAAGTCHRETIRLLAQIFSPTFIDVQHDYKSAKLQMLGRRNFKSMLTELKRNIFTFLVGGVGPALWHGQSVVTMQLGCRGDDDAGRRQSLIAGLPASLNTVLGLGSELEDDESEAIRKEKKPAKTPSSSPSSQKKVKTFMWQ